MRGSFFSDSECKLVTKLIVATPDRRLNGFAVISVAGVRACNAEIVDTRSQYLGHADLRIGIARRKGEVLPPAEKLLYDERLEALHKSCKYIPDPNPDDFRWHGAPLVVD